MDLESLLLNIIGARPDPEEDIPSKVVTFHELEPNKEGHIYAILDQLEDYHKKCYFCHKECDPNEKHYCSKDE